MKKLLPFISLVFFISFHTASAQCPEGIAITEVLVDPNSTNGFNFDSDGDGDNATNDEFVKICNTSASDADLSGFSLNDLEKGDWFTFPEGTIIVSGNCITVVNDWDGSTPPAAVFDADNGGGNIIGNYGDEIRLTSANGDCIAFNAVPGTDGCPQDIDGVSLNCGDVASYPWDAPVGALPVDLISFTAKGNQHMEIDLDWSTASEENNSHFEIEHSTNGRDFTYIDKVIGVGTTSEIQNYQFTHTDAATGKNYYRLLQVDFDGAFEYSSVAVVTMRTEAVIEVRPTMVTSFVQVMLEEGLTTDIELRVVDITGRQLQTATIERGTQQFELDATNLQKGAYFIQFNVAGEIITRRFIKM